MCTIDEIAGIDAEGHTEVDVLAPEVATERGLLSLDERVLTYLPDFALASAATTEALPVRHLLQHTGGGEGDYTLALGAEAGGSDRGAMGRAVAALRERGQEAGHLGGHPAPEQHALVVGVLFELGHEVGVPQRELAVPALVAVADQP